jgi:hypothetical protein
MSQTGGSVPVIEGCRPGALPIDELLESGRPAVLKSIAHDWPLVQAGAQGPDAASDYLRALYNGRPLQYSYGGPDIAGRPFYNSDFTELNFDVRRGGLDEVLDGIGAHADDARPPTYYVASLLVDSCLPGFGDANTLGLTAHDAVVPGKIWIGNRVTASCHYDAPNNIACCAVGRRRFTLLPPEQIWNLYPGPLEPAPGGQAVSLVDFHAPDLERYPRFREAQASAMSVVLDSGDALFIPSMWWHHVEGLDAFTVLVNYWWSSVPSYVPTPMHAMYHAIWTIRDRPEREKKAWRDVFDYYVFGPGEQAGEHMPEAARRLLGPIDETQARQLRALLIRELNR